MSKKPKPCKVRVYVYNYLSAIYNPATEVKPFFGLPTLSQAFQEFMDFNAVDLLMDKDLMKLEPLFGKRLHSLKVKCATAKLWDSLSNEQKEHLLFHFNVVLAIRLDKLFGGVWL